MGQYRADSIVQHVMGNYSAHLSILVNVYDGVRQARLKLQAAYREQPTGYEDADDFGGTSTAHTAELAAMDRSLLKVK